MKVKPKQIFIIMKCQKKVLIIVSNIDSVFNMGKTYYPQVFLEQCKTLSRKER